VSGLDLLYHGPLQDGPVLRPRRGELRNYQTYARATLVLPMVLCERLRGGAFIGTAVSSVTANPRARTAVTTHEGPRCSLFRCSEVASVHGHPPVLLKFQPLYPPLLPVMVFFFRPRSRETFQGLEELTKISSNSQNLTRSCSSKGRYRLPKTSAKTSLALNAASFAGKEKSRTEGWETQASLQSLRKCPYLRSASRRAKQCGSGHL